MKISGWGRNTEINAKVLLPTTLNSCTNLLKSNAPLIPRGMGRSYGDSANSATVLQSTYLDHYIKFDELNGILTCEAGVSIHETLQLVIPKGWFIPVTPGTAYVTIAGAIASDVHGKNHHINGTFCEHVLSFDLLLGTGEVVTVSKTNLPELYRATCGGMGLTGIILSATIKLKKIQSSQIIQTTLQASCIEELCQLFEKYKSVNYSVAWIDCLAKGKGLGRSLLMLGEHAEDGMLDLPHHKTINIPANMPQILLNPYSIKAFNSLYYHKNLKKNNVSTLGFKSFFYPLDSIDNWNRLYGKSGFIQYQFALPIAVGVEGLKQILSIIADSGKGSFLAVLKVFGNANNNYLSFPVEGYTLALDFKISPSIPALIKQLDAMVISMGGKVYLAKDSFLSETFFKKMYPKWEEFEDVRSKYGALGKFASCQSKRLGLK